MLLEKILVINKDSNFSKALLKIRRNQNRKMNYKMILKRKRKKLKMRKIKMKKKKLSKKRFNHNHSK